MHMNIASAMRAVQHQLLGRPRYDLIKSRHTDGGRCEFLLQDNSGQFYRLLGTTDLCAPLEGDKTADDVLLIDDLGSEEEFDDD
jgi:hypothetical protein